LTGARQTGKSTLISSFKTSVSLTFDDWSTQQSAKTDPMGFIQSLAQTSFPIAIDEVQLVPDIILPIKKVIDDNRQPGMFLLTGSANLLHWPRLPDSLAGRVEYITLRPLSLSEVVGHEPHWIDQLLDNPTSSPMDIFQETKRVSNEILDQMMMRGGYPEAYKRESLNRRTAWQESYLKTLIERDVRNLETIENPFILHHLMTHLALNVGSLVNFSNIALKLRISVPTVQKYMRLLSLLYLSSELPAWHRNIGKRLIKTPKIFLCDTGLLHYLTHSSGLENKGALTEHFVYNELQKQIEWSSARPQLYYWRTSNGHEVDFLLEDRRGHILGIEVKSSIGISESDFSNLRILQKDIPDQFMSGFVLYRGERILPFGPKLWAIPLNLIF
jgi:predicted AAA+ superfamily ATPase